MGLFDFAKSVTDVSSGNKHYDCSLKEYGVASVYWSAGNSQTLIDSIFQIPKVPNEDGTSLVAGIEKFPRFAEIAGIKKFPRFAEIVFIGLYTATYLVYAIKMLGFEGENEKNELVAGVKEGFLKLCSSNLPPSASVKDKELYVEYLTFTMSSFYPAIARDIYRIEPKDEEICLMAISLFERMNKTEYETSENTIIEKMLLYPIIQGEPIQLIVAIRSLLTRVGNNIRMSSLPS